MKMILLGSKMISGDKIKFLMSTYLKPLLLIFFFFTFCANAQKTEKNKNEFDGPYLIYQGDSILVKTIDYRSVNASLKSYARINKGNVKIEVKFSDFPDKNFQVDLRKNITNEPSVWKQPEKMFVISDIEGEFDAFRNLLLANKIINEKYEWTFGKGHVVVCGDLFDRGKEVPATLWLLYKLEDDAKTKGGYVHTILGNHDIMNLAGNLKYLDKKYLKSAELMNTSYDNLYDENTELGRWLRSKNLIEKIGNNLCLHGGISPEVNGLKLSVEELNQISKPYIGWKDLKNTVTDQKILDIFSSTIGLFWYRGYFKGPPLEESAVDQTLKMYHAKCIIVGHTILKNNISFYYNGKVLAVDVNQHEGNHQAVLYENKQWYKLDLTGDKKPLNK